MYVLVTSAPFLLSLSDPFESFGHLFESARENETRQSHHKKQGSRELIIKTSVARYSSSGHEYVPESDFDFSSCRFNLGLPSLPPDMCQKYERILCAGGDGY